MIRKILSKIFGTRNDRMLASLKPLVQAVEDCETALKELTDAELASQTSVLKKQLDAGDSLDEILPKAFAVVREASVRVLKKRHYDVQVIGGIALHKGWLAEAKTGEGKTLMATLPSYLNALSGKSVILVLPNNYLAERDATEMGKIYNFLGLTASYVTDDMDFEKKQAGYRADIVYTTHSCLGFDYLRDNMRIDNTQRLLKDLSFCIVDEVDSILIDDARTPLILTGASDTSSELYEKLYSIIKTLHHEDDLSKSDVEIDRKDNLVLLTDHGSDKLQEILIQQGIIDKQSSLFDLDNTTVCHYANACLQARFLFQKDVDYIVDKKEIVIIEKSTGRKAVGKRWRGGIHQAVEAKEGLEIQRETQTTASITYQNLFRLFDKLSGMTGTADTEAVEFKDIYNLDVLVIPLNKKCIRDDLIDRLYITEKEKTQAIVKEIAKRHESGQPLLIGTSSIEYSEKLSKLLQKEKIKHEVLNAKQHEKESFIIENAGRFGAVTIATNMAGRGTDIILGGHPDKTENWEEAHQKVLEVGGLHVLGTERHESRRVDNQLRGRSGRQGDPGSAQFYVSFEDHLMRFAPESIVRMLKNLSTEGEAIEEPTLSISVENAQKRTESRDYDRRKELLKLDDVANQQRQIIYAQRNELLESEDISEVIDSMIDFAMRDNISKFLPDQDTESWDIKGLEAYMLQFSTKVDLSGLNTAEEIFEKLIEGIKQHLDNKKKNIPEKTFKLVEKRCLLMVIDKCWKEHLAAMDHLRQGIGFRSFANKNPTHEFKKDSFALFERMLKNIKIYTVVNLCLVSIQPREKKSQGYAVTSNTPAKPKRASGGYQINQVGKKEGKHETP